MELKDILKEAYDGVAAELDVIHEVSFSRNTPGSYNTATGTTTPGATLSFNGRAIVESDAAIRNNFPGYVVTGKELQLFVEGLTTEPREGDVVFATRLGTKKVVAVANILGVGQGFRVLVN